MEQIDRILAKREAFGAKQGLEDGLTKDERIVLARFEQVTTRLYLAQERPEIQNLMNCLEEMQRHKPATRFFDCPDCGCRVIDCERCDKLICTGCDEPTLCVWD